MADFKTHTLVGTGVGITMSYMAYARSWTNELIFLILIYVAAIIGSFLPDLDADSGKPIRIIFTFFGVVGAGITYLIQHYVLDLSWSIMIVSICIAFIIIRYFLSFIFRKITKHRGILHSLPMMVIFFLITFSISSLFQISIWMKFIISLTVMFGFLSHLVLDEIYATKNFMGIPYKVGRSFGNAIKLSSKSERVTTLVYILLIFLFFFNLDDLIKIF